VLLIVVAAGVSGGGEGDASNTTTGPGGSPAGSIDPTASAVAVPSTQLSIGAESTLAPVVKTNLAQPLAKGSFGDDVKLVQQRLADLGFAPGTIDGQFGSLTQQAVWAYKKLVGGFTYQELNSSNNKTVVTDELWQKMQDPIVVQPRRPQGVAGRTHVEVYLPLQVLAVFTDDRPVFIAHISTGELDPTGQPVEFCEEATFDTDENGEPLDPPVTKAVCADSKTPGGIFKIRRFYDGKRVGPLGGMLNPVYFNYGIAIHGAENVPTAPASHGCVRIHNQLAEVFPGLVAKGDRVFVWGHDGKEPEYYSRAESLPSFNRPDPNATTTTTTTTTVATTEVPTATTVKSSAPTTTKPPATTVPTTTTTIATTTTSPPATDPP
jgi:L,D-transpeptidase catalytic domain/Putative peptidoglycan binding domain